MLNFTYKFFLVTSVIQCTLEKFVYGQDMEFSFFSFLPTVGLVSLAQLLSSPLALLYCTSTTTVLPAAVIIASIYHPRHTTHKSGASIYGGRKKLATFFRSPPTKKKRDLWLSFLPYSHKYGRRSFFFLAQKWERKRERGDVVGKGIFLQEWCLAER